MRPKKTNPVKPRPAYAFVVDGNCEVWYLDMLKRNARELLISIEPKIPQKKSIKAQFESVKSLSESYTKVFWIVDLDNVLKERKEKPKGAPCPMQTFIQYRNEVLKLENVTVIVNNPCLEFWLLLHFESTARYFQNCEAAGKQLKKHIPAYEKTQKFYTQDNDIYKQLNPKLTDAIRNAAKLKAFDPSEPDKAVCEMALLFAALFPGELPDQQTTG